MVGAAARYSDALAVGGSERSDTGAGAGDGGAGIGRDGVPAIGLAIGIGMVGALAADRLPAAVGMS